MAAAEKRHEGTNTFENVTFDLLVVGGGINGAGIALDASLRGMKVALIEKNRFASGTSSKSSKLIHGGIRYLEQFQFHLVAEACRERHRLLQNAAGLVWPLPMLLPHYGGSGRSSLKIKLGLFLYDLLAMFRNVRNHESLSRKEVLKKLPDLRKEGLEKGFLFFDAQTDDAALVRALVDSAVAQGCIAIEGREAVAVSLDSSGVSRVGVRNGSTNEESSMSAWAVINASGPWADRVRRLEDPARHPLLRPSKGVHLLIDAKRLPLPFGLLLFHPRDGRVFFLLPWKERTLVGTTDTDFAGDPDDVGSDIADVEYLLEGVNHSFPESRIGVEDVMETFAGLRPLLAGDVDYPSELSREHMIEVSPRGLITLVGGKLTTYRAMAEETVDLALRELKRRSWPGSPGKCRTKRWKISSRQEAPAEKP